MIVSVQIMNHSVAYELITSELGAHRALSFAELTQLVGEKTSRLVYRDGIDYDLATFVSWYREPNAIRVHVSVGEADWGNPHDSLDDEIVIIGPDISMPETLVPIKNDATEPTKLMDEREYWLRLEHRLSIELAGMPKRHRSAYWCDGICPELYFLADTPPYIGGHAWICTDQQQDEWKFEFFLPQKYESREQIDWAALLPPENVTRWIALDEERKLIQIEPAAAVPDLTT
jgi:hypothetical protein